jgi:hypothetical protein
VKCAINATRLAAFFSNLFSLCLRNSLSSIYTISRSVLENEFFHLPRTREFTLCNWLLRRLENKACKRSKHSPRHPVPKRSQSLFFSSLEQETKFHTVALLPLRLVSLWEWSATRWKRHLTFVLGLPLLCCSHFVAAHRLPLLPWLQNSPTLVLCWDDWLGRLKGLFGRQ